MEPHWVHEYALHGDLGLNLERWETVEITVQEYAGDLWRLVVYELSDGEAMDGHTADGFTTAQEAMAAAEAWFAAWKQAKAIDEQ